MEEYGENAIKRLYQSFDVDEKSNCWVWKKSLRGSGYGHFFDKRYKTKIAHRLSYFYHVRELDKSVHLDHLCRNRLCVNPDHLEEVTNKENCNRGANCDVRKILALKITHCPKGHEYTEENSNIYKNRYGKPTRSCRECSRIRASRRYSLLPDKEKERLKKRVQERKRMIREGTWEFENRDVLTNKDYKEHIMDLKFPEQISKAEKIISKMENKK